MGDWKDVYVKLEESWLGEEEPQSEVGKEEPSPEEMQKTAMSTNRTFGSVGLNAITPRYVATVASPDDLILDFGAGKHAMHTKLLRGVEIPNLDPNKIPEEYKGKQFNVIAYDFDTNVESKYHDKNALKKINTFDIVYASNVLNVQSNEKMLREWTIEPIVNVLKSGGRFIGNFPSSPRYLKLKPTELREVLKEYFVSVAIVNKNSSAPLFDCKKG